ncbi:hypothetical protein TNCV_2274431 [Trichonephila clavipes]|nr:hypothetical protein TNCV_2274431 [Trichonephila clavipes]
MASGIEPRLSGLESDALTTRLPGSSSNREVSVKCTFRNLYGKEVPSNKVILRWYHPFQETTACVKRKAAAGQASW